MHLTYKHTKYACYLGYVSQSITASLPPLLFVTFSSTLGMSIARIAGIVFLGYIIQLAVDVLSIFVIDKIGYRKCAVMAEGFVAIGLFFLAALPSVLDNSATGFLIAVIVYSVGAGFIEVLISPIVQYLPSEGKAQEMSALHSTFCWGAAGCILIGTLLLASLPATMWYVVPVLMALVPFFNMIFFMGVPIIEPKSLHEPSNMRDLLGKPMMIIFLIMIFCGGAAEQAVFQWASYFTEKALMLPKMYGDLAGPFLFAVLMGFGRSFYSVRGVSLSLISVLKLCCILYIACILIVSFSPIPLISATFCGVCGLAISMMWPGTISLAAESLPRAGTVLFGMLAVAGDVGCAAGTWSMGALGQHIGIEKGFLFAMVFPALMLICIILMEKIKSR